MFLTFAKKTDNGYSLIAINEPNKIVVAELPQTDPRNNQRVVECPAAYDLVTNTENRALQLVAVLQDRLDKIIMEFTEEAKNAWEQWKADPQNIELRETALSYMMGFSIAGSRLTNQLGQFSATGDATAYVAFRELRNQTSEEAKKTGFDIPKYRDNGILSDSMLNLLTEAAQIEFINNSKRRTKQTA